MKDDVSAVKNAAKIAVFGRPEGGQTPMSPIIFNMNERV